MGDGSLVTLKSLLPNGSSMTWAVSAFVLFRGFNSCPADDLKIHPQITSHGTGKCQYSKNQQPLEVLEARATIAIEKPSATNVKTKKTRNGAGRRSGDSTTALEFP